MNVWSIYMLLIWTFFCFQASTALCIFMSTHANSWIKVAARLNTLWIRFGKRRAIRRRVEAGMALTAIGEIAQWGGVADCSGCRTFTFPHTCLLCSMVCEYCTKYFGSLLGNFLEVQKFEECMHVLGLTIYSPEMGGRYAAILSLIQRQAEQRSRYSQTEVPLQYRNQWFWQNFIILKCGINFEKPLEI